MKKNHILLLAAFMCGTAWAEDNNSFYFTDAAIKPGETTNIELCMRNSATDLTCVEAEIQLPEGLSVVCDEEGKPIATLHANRVAGHEILTNVLDNGNLKLLVCSVSGNLIGGEEGPLLSFCVQADEVAPKGECVVKTVGESLLVNSEAEAFYSVGVAGNVLITDDVTAIDHTPQAIDNSEAVYDLAGRKMNSKHRRGLFIKGGRKELHK